MIFLEFKMEVQILLFSIPYIKLEPEMFDKEQRKRIFMKKSMLFFIFCLMSPLRANYEQDLINFITEFNGWVAMMDREIFNKTRTRSKN